MGYYDDWGFSPYVSQAERRAEAARKLKALAKKGHVAEPVNIPGRAIATTFWGKAWCDNLEAYSDYANRLPRGRTYARNGSVVDLKLQAGEVTALVSGSELYEVSVSVKALPAARWKHLVQASAGQMLSMVDLLTGTFSREVMERFCKRGEGLFPEPKELSFECSCPDQAEMCKHVAAALYGVGARLDGKPELLFTLRQVDPAELLSAASARPAQARGPAPGKALAPEQDLGALFGIDLGAGARPAPQPAPAQPSITAQELLDAGLDRKTIRAWVRQGLLRKASPRGAYHYTEEAEARAVALLDAALAQG